MKTHYLLLLFVFSTSYSQIAGCTDSLSINYNKNATVNNGSCNYKSAKIKAVTISKLPISIKETSGLIYYNELLWTFNDDSDTQLYVLDTSGKIIKTVTINNVTNTDWEAITQDSTHIYIGDFGNNVSGNRDDLHILKIAKKSLFEQKQQVDTIWFSYNDQDNLMPAKANTNNFDCEAFIIKNGSIYLFSKQWSAGATTLYKFPNIAGKQIATKIATLDVKGLITDAHYDALKNAIVLSGYSKTLQPFIYLLSHFEGNNFFSGNKRKIKLRLPFHQVEGITSPDGLDYYISNEQFTRKPFLNIPQQLHLIDLRKYIY